MHFHYDIYHVVSYYAYCRKKQDRSHGGAAALAARSGSAPRRRTPTPCTMSATNEEACLSVGLASDEKLVVNWPVFMKIDPVRF
jgi:hypothetical protein